MADTCATVNPFNFINELSSYTKYNLLLMRLCCEEGYFTYTIINLKVYFHKKGLLEEILHYECHHKVHCSMLP